MGILFTKLWRLFNHQGKNYAVTFIMKLSKTLELSGLDGQKRPSLKGGSAPLLALETAFNTWQFISKLYFSIIMSFAVTLFFFTYFLPQRSPRVDSVIIVSSINWLRMSFSTSAHRAFIDLVLDYLCSLGLERRLGETKSIPSKWSWIGEQAGRCETSVTWAPTFRHAFSPVDRYYDWRSHTHTQSTPKSATSAELFSQQGSMNDWNHFDFVQPL